MSVDINRLVIGDPGCEINELSCLLVDGHKDTMVEAKLGSIGISLGIKQTSIDEVLTHLKQRPCEIRYAVSKLLQHYKSEKPAAATLQSLLDALEKSNLRTTQNAIENHFKEKMKPRNIPKYRRKQSIDEDQPDMGSCKQKLLLKEDRNNTNTSGNEEEDHGVQCYSIPINIYSLTAITITLLILITMVSLFYYLKRSKVANAIADIDEESGGHNITVTENIFRVSSYAQFDKIFKSIPKCCNGLNISIQNSSHWLPGQKHGGGRFLKEITITGPLDAAALAEILSDAVNLNALQIYNTKDLFCKQNRYQSISPPINSVSLNYLNTIYFNNFTTCREIYSRLVASFKINKLSHIHIRNSQLNDANIGDIRQLMEKSHSSLECIELSFYSRTKESLLNVEFNYPKVRKIKYNIVQHSVDGNKFWPSVRENFSDTFLNLESFESKRGIMYADLINLLKCKHLESINATVYFTGTDESWNLAAGHKGGMLVQVDVTLLFTSKCPSLKEIWRYGVSKFSDRARSFKIVSNCIIMQQMVANNDFGEEMYVYSRHRRP